MTAPVNFYADFQGLASLKHDAKAQDPGALKEVAKQFESLFTQMMLKSMRDANRSMGEDSMFGSEQADFYQDMFDDQLAVHLSKGKGLGLADMLLRQLAQSGGGPGTGDRGLGVERSTAAPSGLQPPASSPQPIASSREDFVQRMLPHAQKAAAALGVDAQTLVAQAALETGWGKSMPCNADGSCSFNLFGIKAGTSWSGETVAVPTLEFENGIAVRKVERFRAYASIGDSFMDYARLIGGSTRYADALGSGTDVASFATALQQGGYATDPEYANKIMSVTRQVRSMTDTTLQSAALTIGADAERT